MLSSNLGLDRTNIDTGCVQRIGQYQEVGKPRKTIVNMCALKTEDPFFYHLLKTAERMCN